MDFQTIYNVLVTVIAITIGGLSLYLKTSEKQLKKVEKNSKKWLINYIH